MRMRVFLQFVHVLWSLETFRFSYLNLVYIKSYPLFETFHYSYIDIVAGLAVSNEGHIVAVDSVSPTVFVISEDGDLVHWFDCSDHMREPSDIAINGENCSFIRSYNLNCLIREKENCVIQEHVNNRDLIFHFSFSKVMTSTYVTSRVIVLPFSDTTVHSNIVLEMKRLRAFQMASIYRTLETF